MIIFNSILPPDRKDHDCKPTPSELTFIDDLLKRKCVTDKRKRNKIFDYAECVLFYLIGTLVGSSNRNLITCVWSLTEKFGPRQEEMCRRVAWPENNSIFF